MIEVLYPVIQFYTSKYCAPCKNVERMLARINLSLFGNQLFIQKIDVSLTDEMELARKNNILSVPSIIVGNKRLTHIMDEQDIVDTILQGFLSSVSLEEEEEP
ncbi:MAG: thioredoxin family protein [Candidatus Lokiarchaeota archaeon]|nr:thioredoxin family protein [Candidatus Lokiarchaeota archaeon]